MSKYGYPIERDLPDGMMTAVVDNMSFGKGRIVHGDMYFIERAWCYETYESAVAAHAAWDPLTQVEPEGWFRCPTDGRRRPNGDKSKEYVLP